MEYKIKQLPEDFIVKEIILLECAEGGIFSYYNMTKKNLTTSQAVDIISKRTGINKKFINYAGTKDKRAITEQKISIKNGPEKNFDFGDLKLEFICKGKERINLGNNIGNFFEIVIRKVIKKPKKIKYFVNYFDDQRFSDNNVLMGKLLIKKNFKKAVEICAEDKKYGRIIKEHIKKNKNDYIGALRKIDRKILKMFIHAYQSYLWNICVSKKLEEYSYKKIKCSTYLLNVPSKKIKNFYYPIVGFGTEEDDIIKGMLKKEGIDKKNFVIREIPELSCEGSERNVFSKVKNLFISEVEEDEINKGNKKIKISFELEKGSYATMAIKQMFI
ncbi:MAG: tRNA pseudouridine(13) synthase TruD [Candidatus Woesearchaeota archaeon]